MSDAVNGQNAGCIGSDQLPAERRFNGCGVSGEQNDRRVQSASSRSSSNENGRPLEQSHKRKEIITDSRVMNRSQKRLDYLDWSEYFMAVAVLSAERSKDPSTQVGACIVDSDKRIVAIGYNGMPSGCSDDLMPWAREADDRLETKYPYVCHAEMNAILNKNSADLQGCVIYVVLFPCNECAKLIIQSGIRHIVYASDKYHEKFEFSAARRLFNTAGITYEPFCPRHQRLTIDLRRSICDIKDNCAVQKERVWHSLNSMRTDYITWSEYFVGVALLSAQRSKDPNTQVGACIVNTRNRIVAIGYNGMPRGCHDDHMPWSKDADNLLETKYPYVCHAEMNAIMNRNCMSLKDCMMYVTRFPCNECAKLILQSGIHSVIYLMDKHPEKFEYCAARKLFDMAGVEYKPYEGCDDARCIVIEFTAL